ncbi:hypothetical protein EKK58_08195 [Candidatus Dependentiae bacterium]|nr:MAG: hypothetical protein EKK58_08195 [Candidatus Dependentiae bacterium]
MSKSTILVMSLLSVSGCVATSGTDRINLCKELPTVSVNDTDQTIIEVDNFNEKYRAAYGCR